MLQPVAAPVASDMMDAPEQPFLFRQMNVLDLEGNDISGDGLLSTNLLSRFDCPLTYLNLSGNALSLKGQQAIAAIVQHNNILKHLAINSCSMELKGLLTLTSSLYENQTLETLLLDRPILTTTREGEVLEHMSKMLANNRSLSTLSFKHFDAVDKDIKLLSNALHTNNTLISLNLECNKIGAPGAEALASALLTKGLYSMQHLGLAYNFVADNGAIALAEAIRSNTGLKTLTLKNNSIGPVGLAALAQALESGSNIESLTIFGNDFDNANGLQFHNLIKHRLPYTQVSIDIDVYIVDGRYLIALAS